MTSDAMNTTRISHIGERALLDFIEGQLKGFQEKPQCLMPVNLVLGFGDDCAAVRNDQSHDLLVSTDLLIEDVHFRRRYFSPAQIGYKALAVNVSDIAAMGGMPTHALVGLAIPSHTDISFVEGLYRGFSEMGDEYGIRVIGGDTVHSPGPVMVAVTILGAVEKGHLVSRKGAEPGDRIMLTGELGSAMRGLEILEAMDRDGQIPQMPSPAGRSISRIFHPVPRVQEGRLLAQNRLATSMIDLSDSLTQDLAYLCQSSKAGARIQKESIPISPDIGGNTVHDPLRYALSGGEEYELLFTVQPGDADRTRDLMLRETGTQVYDIGEIRPAGEGISLTDENGNMEPLLPTGFEHFSPAD